MHRVRMVALSMVLMNAAACESADESGDGGVNTDLVAPAELVPPIERSGAYVLELTDGANTLLFECRAEDGGLVTRFELNGEEMLSQLTAANAYGSTFWTSPQSDWGWPPPAAIGSNPYTVTVEADTIVLTGEADAELGLQVVKRFSPDLADMAVKLEYRIVNTGAEARSVAPWEITRVVPGGLTFFAKGSGIFDVGSMQALPITESDGIVWFDNPVESELSGDYKLFADGADGWLAHAQDGMVFVKTFGDTPADARAPDEAEIEIYAKGGAYAEIEQQGAYQSVPAGGQITWEVKWHLRPMPDGANQAVGDMALADFAASLSTP